MKIEEILNNERQVSGDYHAAAGKAWRIHGEKDLLHSSLIYSVFEFRLAVERYVFELYLLMEIDQLLEINIPDEALKRFDNFKSLIRILHENAGNKFKLFRVLIFNRHVSEIYFQIPKKLSVPDIGKLSSFWHSLSEYCHKQYKLDNSWASEDWIKKGYKLINEVESYLIQISIIEAFGWVNKNSLGPELSQERERFLNDKEFTEERLTLRLTLMKPVLDLKAGVPTGILKIN